MYINTCAFQLSLAEIIQITFHYDDLEMTM